VVVALNSKARAKKEMGGSGSLIVAPKIIGKTHIDPKCPDYLPLAVGQIEPEKGYVHVFDDVTLDLVMRELDTVTDFVRYLTEKESLITSGRLLWALGEEELLALYIKNRNEAHPFGLPPGASELTVSVGLWDRLQSNPQYIGRNEKNKRSYLWDGVIEEISKHALGGTLVPGSHSISESESVLRIMARETRFSRRVLARHMLDLLERVPPGPGQRVTRRIMPDEGRDTGYVFALLSTGSLPYEEYRSYRRRYLQDYCFVFAWKHREIKCIVGIATEAGSEAGSSHDLVCVEVSEWTPDMENDARKLQEHWGIMKDDKVVRSYYVEDEYPGTAEVPPARNDSCPCKSGRKYKNCCDK
jgi:hypothetical protein